MLSVCLVPEVMIIKPLINTGMYRVDSASCWGESGGAAVSWMQWARTLHNEDIHNMCSSPDIITVMK
jgi:hypothetical protein